MTDANANGHQIEQIARSLGLPAHPDWSRLAYQGYGNGRGTPVSQAELDQILAAYWKRWTGQPRPSGVLVLVRQGNNGAAPAEQLGLERCAPTPAALVEATTITGPTVRRGDVYIYPPTPAGRNGTGSPV